MADADLTQFNRVAADAEAANLENPLTGPLLVPTDGKKITADANGAGKAPVNKSIKKNATRIAGLLGWIVGNVAGITPRTLKALHLDGAGGNASTAASGQLKALTALLSVFSRVTDGTDLGTLEKDKLTIDRSGGAGGTGVYTDGGAAFTGTAASGGNPASTADISNAVLPLNQVKVHGRITTNGAGAATVVDGAHIASAAPNGANIRVNFASNFDNADYSVSPHGHDAAVAPVHVKVAVRNVAYVELLLIGCNATNQQLELNIFICGRQTT